MDHSTNLTSSRRTRVTNASKHPGLPDAPARRRSHAEKTADDAEQSELQAMQEAKALRTLDTIASVEESMGASQQTKGATVKNGVRPTTPRSVKHGVAAANVPKGNVLS